MGVFDKKGEYLKTFKVLEGKHKYFLSHCSR